MTEPLAPPSAQLLRDVWLEESDALDLIDETKRHRRGSSFYFIYIFARREDNTFWQVEGITGGDGDDHDLRDSPEHITPKQVFPHTRTVTTTEFKDQP